MDEELEQEIVKAMEFHYQYGFYPALSIEAWIHLRGGGDR